MISLLVANNKEIHTSPEEFLGLLRNFHPELADAKIMSEMTINDENGIYLEIQWQNQHVRILGINAPLPAEVIHYCISTGLYADEIKSQIERHISHFLLHSLSAESNALEQYVALTAIAVALEPIGAIAVINEVACTSYPVTPLVAKNSALDQMEYLRTLPLALIFCGINTFQLENTDIIWSRTYGAEIFLLPNLAIQHQPYLNLDLLTFFSDILKYFFFNQPLLAGMTMNYGEYLFHFRMINANENFLSRQEDNLLVIEIKI